MAERKTYWFKKHYPGFCTGFESKFDYIEFKNWKSFIKKYTKEFPLIDDYVYCFGTEDYKTYYLMASKLSKKEWWVVGTTNYPIINKYKHYETAWKFPKAYADKETRIYGFKNLSKVDFE